MSAVKIGDRVRATCGGSVLVGTVMDMVNYQNWICAYVDGDTGRRVLSLDLWTVEVLPPPIPDVEGTIIRDRDGDAWQRYDDRWCCVGSYSYSLAEVQKRYSPLTVLWTPGETT